MKKAVSYQKYVLLTMFWLRWDWCVKAVFFLFVFPEKRLGYLLFTGKFTIDFVKRWRRTGWLFVGYFLPDAFGYRFVKGWPRVWQKSAPCDSFRSVWIYAVGIFQMRTDMILGKNFGSWSRFFCGVLYQKQGRMRCSLGETDALFGRCYACGVGVMTWMFRRYVKAIETMSADMGALIGTWSTSDSATFCKGIFLHGRDFFNAGAATWRRNSIA